MYELVIVGGGPGAVAAGVYAARKKINTALVAESFGGQSIVSEDIQNWIGTPSIAGFELAMSLEKHLRSHEGVEILDGDLVVEVKETEAGLEIKTKTGKILETKYLLVASGGRHKKLEIPGEKEYDGKGVVYCSTCDAPLFKDKRAVVVGGGNAGLEAVRDLLPYASEIYLMLRSETPRGDAVTFEKIKENPKVKMITQAEPKEILGEAMVTGLKYLDKKDNSEKNLPLEGVFVEIGVVPNSDFVKDLVKLDERGQIVVDHKTQKTSHPKIWAVGDVSDVLYKQNNISAGDGVKALLNIYDELHRS